MQDLLQLDREEWAPFMNEVITRLNSLKADAFDRFYEKVEAVLLPETKNHLWERNNFLISGAIHNHIHEHCCMPTKQEISNVTGLSRQTIHKHLKEYADHP